MKRIKIIGYILLGLSAIIILHFFIADMGTLEKGLAATQDMPSDMKVMEVENLAADWNSIILDYAIVLMVACAILAIAFSLYQFVQNTISYPKKAIRSGIAVVAIGVIILISYFLASDSIPNLVGDITVTHTTSKWVETGLIFMYFTFGITLVSLLVGEISKIWK